LVDGWLHQHVLQPTSTMAFLWHRQNLIAGIAVLVAGIYIYRSRLDPVWAAVLIWLVVYAASINWNYNNLIWGLPFFLLARRNLEVLALTLVLALPAAEMYFGVGVP